MLALPGLTHMAMVSCWPNEIWTVRGDLGHMSGVESPGFSTQQHYWRGEQRHKASWSPGKSLPPHSVGQSEPHSQPTSMGGDQETRFPDGHHTVTYHRNKTEKRDSVSRSDSAPVKSE